MKKLKIVLASLLLIITCTMFVGCSNNGDATSKDISNTQQIANKLTESQPTPTDVNYSLERYNLIRRAYWVNGQREKAISLPCKIVKPLGYIVLFTNSGSIVGRFIVDGKITSLNSFLTPDMVQEWHSSSSYKGYKDVELPDVDGSYGENVDGIFFFTTDGKYIEWTGDFLYSDIPFTVDTPILNIGE